MSSSLGKIVSACCGPLSQYVRMNRDDNSNRDINNEDASITMLGEEDDPSIWYKDLEKHFCGEFSFAAAQANRVMEDQGQVETGKNATFVGVYDGHGSHETARFIGDNLFYHLIKLAQENGTMSEGVICNAFSETEDGFLSIVKQLYPVNRLVASWGSCCLVGVIWEGKLFVANLGDSRAVLGCVGQKMLSCLCQSKRVTAKQLTKDHNANMKEVRQELRSSHPDDPQIVLQKFNVWRIKGIIQVSRSIGDAYLKNPDFALDESYPRFHLPEPLRQPVLRADPSICTRTLQPSDKFLIFASDGLWEHLSNQEAVEIVHKNPREGIARRLLRLALQKAAAKVNRSYDELKGYDQGKRRLWHDDITVAVIFLDYEMLNNKAPVPERSFRAFVDSIAPSKFKILQGNDVNPESVE
ncbi:probable protein phosphatase 2C 43 [Coffea eugenioides]|uniref:probable protein phosphatase 2C 43 n=1 Tax=Coffea eugenioides TaxID=49369 RepID=UPI000F606192|nr:probable protein phosphatase 2C 43 [Coffea eugenioides]